MLEAIKNKNLSQSFKKLIVSRFFALVILVFSFSFSAFSQEVDIAKGKALFNANCAACHKLNKNLIGPALAGVSAKYEKDLISKNKKLSKHRIYNLGNNSPVVLNTMIKLLEETIGKKANKKLVSMQPGDVKKTFADIEKSKRELKFQPKTSLRQGLTKFVNWYKEYHKI